MRNIKFRLIRDNKIVGYEILNEQRGNIFQWNYEIVRDMKDEIHGPSGLTCNFILHERKDQFIGLCDKNGKELYENDKVLITGSMVIDGGIKTIGFERGSFVFDNKSWELGNEEYNWDEIEFIERI